METETIIYGENVEEARYCSCGEVMDVISLDNLVFEDDEYIIYRCGNCSNTEKVGYPTTFVPIKRCAMCGSKGSLQITDVARCLLLWVIVGYRCLHCSHVGTFALENRGYAPFAGVID